ncbi:uncharacterized protein HaLaN_13320, partial [Haematococcus lacustris]
GYASTYDLLALLTLALNFNQAPNVAGTNNSANSAQLRTFKGFTFPFGVNFATSNTFAGKTKAQLDATVKSNQAAALSDGAADGRAIAFPLVGDVQVVQGLISSALSQASLVGLLLSSSSSQGWGLFKTELTLLDATVKSNQAAALSDGAADGR